MHPVDEVRAAGERLRGAGRQLKRLAYNIDPERESLSMPPPSVRLVRLAEAAAQ